MKIVTRLWLLFLLVAVLPLALFGYLNIQMEDESLHTEALGRMSRLGDKKVTQIKSYLAERIQDAKFLARGPRVLGAIRVLPGSYTPGQAQGAAYAAEDALTRQYFSRYVEETGLFYDVFLIDPRGEVIYSQRRETDFATNLLTGPLRESQLAQAFRNARMTLEPVISGYEHYAPSSAPSLFIAAPIIVDGKYRGVFALQLGNELFYRVATDTSGLGQSGEIEFARRDGDGVLFTTPLKYQADAALNFRVKGGEGRATAIFSAVSGESGAGERMDYRGKPVVAAWNYLPELNWGVVVKMDADEVFAPLVEHRIWMLGALLGLLLLTGVAAYYLGRQISEPLKGLADTVGEMAMGNLDKRADESAPGELGLYAKAFNRMVEKLQALYRTLENRVAERTRDLHESNKLLQGEIVERNRAQEELKQTKARYDYATAIGRVGTWDWQLETGALIWSDETFRLMGLPPGEVTPSFELFMEKVHPGDREFLNNSVQAALHENKPYALDCRIVAGGEGVSFCHIEGKVEFDAAGEPVRMVGTIQDVTVRKQAEEVLKRHKQVLEITSDGFWLTDAMGNLQMSNQAYADISGYTVEELEHMHISQLEAKEASIEEVKAHIAKIIAVGSDTFETRHRHKDGHEIDIEVTTSFLPESQQFAAFLRDITERKRIENELKNSRDQYDRLTTNIPIGVYLARTTAAGEVVFKYVSARFCVMLDVAAESVYADSGVPFKAIHPDDLEEFIKLNQVAVQTRQPFLWEGRSLVGGVTRWLRIESQPEPLANGDCIWDGVMADITERKRMEEEISQREALFRNYFELGQIGMAITSPEQGWLRVNNRLCEMFGYTKEELNKMTWAELTYPDDLEQDMAQFNKLLSGAIDRYSMDKRFVRKDGSIVYTYLAVFCQHKPDGSPDYFMASLQDITDRKRAQIELQHNQNLLNEAQRLGHLGSWELNLLSGVLWWSDEIYHIFELDPAQFSPTYENFLKVIHPEDRDKVNQAYTQSLQDRLPYDVEHRLQFADGRIKWVREHCSSEFDATGKPLRSVGAVQDITAHKLAEDRLRIAAIAFETHEAILITDANANILRVNQAFQDITGYSSEEVLGKNPRILRSGRHDRDFYAEMWRQLLTTGSWSGELWDKRKDGKIYPKWLTITAVKNELGETTEYVAIFSDITARKQAEEDIHTLAFYDSLTRLPNRRLLLDRFRMALSISARSHHYGAVLFLDMDKFKTLNDTLGHDYGDLLLIEVARRIQSCVREADTVSRLGGDEFVVLLEEIDANAEEASQKAALIAEKIRLALSEPYQLKEHEHHSSPSIGVSLYRGSGESVDELLKHADMAMYQAKDSGRNAVRFYDPAMQRAVEARASLEADLRRALPGNQLRLFYQMQVDSGHRPLGVEALVRWIHPKRGMVPPGQFIPIAEESSLILDIGYWVLETACRQLKAWSKNELTRHLTIAVNVSGQQFRMRDYVDKVASTLRAHEVDPALLKLELTESVILNDVADVVAKMRALKTLGVKLSMDDFGTGYSSLSYLKQLPLDQIKIDQSFVRDIVTDPNDAVMVQTIIGMAKNFRLNVIAEGVETEAQLEFLEHNGCMEYQGYLFGKPVPVEDFEKLLGSEADKP